MKRPQPFTLRLLPMALAAALLTGPTAHAQISTNPDALPVAAPPPPKAVPSRTTHSPVARSARSGTIPNKPETAPVTPPPTSTATHAVLPPAVPAAAPAPVIIPPPTVEVPIHPAVPPTPVTPVAGAPGSVSERPDGVRVLFGQDKADVSPATFDALKAAARRLAARPDLRVTLLSYAPGKTDDYSMPRRVALARALVVRSILINGGVATTRIYPRAIGVPPAGDSSPPDRLDVIAEGAVPLKPAQAQFGTAAVPVPSSSSPAQKATP